MLLAEAVSEVPSFIVPLLWLAPLPLFVAFALIALGFNKSRPLTTLTAMTAVIASCVMSFVIFFTAVGIPNLGEHPIGSQILWIPTLATGLKIGVAVDPLNALFLFMVPLACTLIFLYSTSYMAADPRYTRFMGYLSLFAGSMMGLVVSDNFLTLFVYWELMGFCSYSLIGFFYNKPSAYKAAVKAFMTTRVGDMFLILGLVYLYWMTGTLNFHEIMHNEEVLTHLASTPAVLFTGISAAGLISLLIFGGTVGKSAQFPLHVWLPDAMEGPTPVSAMIHAATMVSAGILLLLRVFPLLHSTLPAGSEVAVSNAFTIIGLIGAITAFIGATIAVGQYDIKRVLAFSTISQLGFMVAAVGIGAYVAATFHLLTHAFFKALLFLGSGSVIHGVEHGHHHLHGHADHGHADEHHATEDEGQTTDAHHDPSPVSGHPSPEHSALSTQHSDAEPEFDPQDMRNMGGLRKRMPITFVTFLIGGLALMGFPFITAGFWSKDEIFADAFHQMGLGNGLAGLIFFTLVFSAFLTTFYTTRQILMTFFGTPRTEAAAHASENDWRMTVPLIILAFFALFAGFANIPSDFPILGSLMGGRAHWLGNLLEGMLLEKEAALPVNAAPVFISVGIVLFGLLMGYAFYGIQPLKAGQTDPVEKLPFFKFLNNRWYFDEFYREFIISPLQWFADKFYTQVIDKGAIDWVLEHVYKLGSAISNGFKTFDEKIVTGFSDFVGRITHEVGEGSREFQSGQVQNYLLSGFVVALVIMAVFLFVN